MCNIRSLFKYTIIAAAVALFLSFSSCKDEPVKPEEKPDISVSVEEVTCTFFWIRIRTNIPSEMKLFRNDSLILQLNPSFLDTLIFDEGLLPSQHYSYKLQAVCNNKTYETETGIESLDTTSHNFTWQSFTFGDYTHSYLKDVAIIDENNIWAVGAIFLNDSLGHGDTDAYNAIHWNGQKWEIKRITYYGACSGVVYPPLLAIWAFSPNDIILTNGGSVGWFDGNSIRLDCRMNTLLDGAINRIWASSNSNVYLVGNNGSLAHYDGKKWTNIESGTTVDLNDIYGTPDGKIIWIGGNTLDKTVLLKIENNTVSKVFDGSAAEMINGRYVGTMNSVWTNSDLGVYYMNGGWGEIGYQRSDVPYLNPKIFTDKIFRYIFNLRGTAGNNLFTAGETGEIGHFNGAGYNVLIRGSNNSSLYAIDMKNNLVVSAGTVHENYGSSKALIIVGKE